MSETTKTSWRPGALTLLIVGSLLLLNFAVIFGESSRFTREFLYLFNIYHWPTWYAVNLWTVFIGLMLLALLKYRQIWTNRCSFLVKWGMILVVILVTFWNSLWVATFCSFVKFHVYGIHTALTRHVYDPYYIGPMTDFATNGTVTWRLLIAPVTGLFMIVGMLFLNHFMKQRRKLS